MKSSKKEAPEKIQQMQQVQQAAGIKPYSRFTDFDIGLFRSGKHFKLYEKLGSHVVEHEGVTGTYFFEGYYLFTLCYK